ncbi:MAG: serine hydroxymethyltransferase [Deltaproteobacteria bacterium]|jgi:glycine hydroxymethyltransferase|nr:serine hydroxymethyltransferase [Deltaproteobacteria bacterium]
MVLQTSLSQTDPAIFELIQKEAQRKELSLELIPSENCVSAATREAVGSILTDKYCEGYPGARYYGGCVNYDEVERLAVERAKTLFSAETANVQPHSGSTANMAVYYSLLKPGDTVLGPRLDHGGHLTHGSPVNFSGKYFRIVAYGLDPQTQRYERDEIIRLAREHKPKMIIAGASAYSRQLDWEAFRIAADEVGAIFMADIAHYAGLIAGGAYQNPFPFADVVTSTTHKTLRGPRGGLILAKKVFASALDKMIFPGIQGGPHMHQVAGKAVAFLEAQSPEFKKYARQVVKNAQLLAEELLKKGFKIVSGGTDSHLLLLDLRGLGVTGAQAEVALDQVGITVNKNTVPDDPQPPKVTSGIRIGTPAITSRGFDSTDIREVANCIEMVVKNFSKSQELEKVRGRVIELCQKRPLFK